jgi:NADPH-dependent curcumin reductase CurA
MDLLLVIVVLLLLFGGAVFEAVFPLLNPFARIPVCGLISMYNATSVCTENLNPRIMAMEPAKDRG